MPVFSSHLVDYPGLGVGRRIREARRQRRLTLRDMAGRLGCSEAKLSNIETDKGPVYLDELCRLAAILGVPISSFLPATRTNHYLIKRSEELAQEAPAARPLSGPEPGPKTHHNRVWSLAEEFVGKHMEPVLVQVNPLRDEELHYIAHDHEEFMFVLTGEVETLLKTNDGLVRERLGAGDCLYFRSSLPHCHRSTTDSPAETLNVMYSLRGAIDPDDAELGTFGRRHYRRGVYADATKEASEKIGLLRRSYGLTLTALAHDLDIGTRQLAEIEHGDKPVRLDVLVRAARRFRRPIDYFFSTTLDRQPYYFLQRATTITSLPIYQRRTAGGDDTTDDTARFRPLAHQFPDRGIHPYLVQVMMNRENVLRSHENHGQEFIYVLDGQVELVAVGEKQVVEVLRPGDAVFMESSIPHVLRGLSRNPYASAGAEVIVVLWSPLSEEYLFGSLAEQQR